MLTLIAAASLNNVIGNDGEIPWRLSNDFKYFKEQTLNRQIIMGRKTFDSLPGVLPNREHIVITREKDFSKLKSHPNVGYVNSLEEALNYTHALKLSSDNVFVIGGGEIYEQALPYANVIRLTRVHTECEGDAFFPEIPKDFELAHTNFCEADEKHEFNYDFLTYIRKNWTTVASDNLANTIDKEIVESMNIKK